MTWLSWLIDLFRAWLGVRAEIQQKQKSMCMLPLRVTHISQNAGA
jgi:hypothetical protein